MSQVIENLLIGVGFQQDKKSFQNASGSLDNLKSKALQIGSLVAGAFGAKALTFGFASETDELGKFADRWGVAANDVSAYDKALGLAGGKTGEFLGNIRSLSKALSLAKFEKAMLVGKLAPLGIAEQVSDVLKGTNALDAFLISADQLATLSDDKREKFIEAMGFSESTVRLLEQGRKGILATVQAQKKMAPVTEKMTATAAKFNDEWQNLGSNAKGFTDLVAEPITSAISDIMAGLNDWIGKNKEVISSVAAFGGGLIADNIGTITTALGIFGTSKLLGGLGLAAKGIAGITGQASLAAGLLSTAASALGILGLAVVGEGIVSGFVNENKDTNPVARFAADYLSDQAALSGVENVYSALTSAAPDVTGLVNNIPTSPSRPYGIQPTQTINVKVLLDGAPVKAIAQQVIRESNDQTIEDFKTSSGA